MPEKKKKSSPRQLKQKGNAADSIAAFLSGEGWRIVGYWNKKK